MNSTSLSAANSTVASSGVTTMVNDVWSVRLPASVTLTVTSYVPGPASTLPLIVHVTVLGGPSGDLQVKLSSPAGSSVLLHNRSGGNTRDLIRSFTSEGVADLAALAGQSAQGTWTLSVADLAGADIGTLRQWSLEVGLGLSTDILSGSAAPAVTIPDNDPTGVDSTIGLASLKVTTAVKVGVDITHMFIGDLRVELIAPSGRRAVLHNRQGGSQDNLITTFDSATNPALAQLIGQAVQGTWTLHISDLAAVDVGKLNKWTLEVTT